MSSTYDATNLKQKGKELIKQISDDINAHENFIIGSIPYILKITKAQYKDMAGEDAFQSMMVVNELDGTLRPDENSKMFYTEEKTNIFGNRSGGYVLEVEIV